MDANTFDFGNMIDLITNLADDLKLSNKHLAEEVGCKYTTFSKYMRDERHMPLDVIIKVAHVLKCDVAFLLGEQDPPIKKYGGVSAETGLSYDASEALCMATTAEIDALSWFIEHGLIDLLGRYYLTACGYDLIAFSYGLQFIGKDANGDGHDLIADMHKREQLNRFDRLATDFINTLRLAHFNDEDKAKDE